MRAIIKIGYCNLLLGKDFNGHLLALLGDARAVTEEYNSGGMNRYKIDDATKIECLLVPDDSMCLPENSNDMLEKYHTLSVERDKLRGEVYNLTKKLEAISATVAPEEKKAV